MDLEDVLAQKRENLRKLIQNEDEAIRREILKYEKAEFYIRLQSECFNLYPVVVQGLALLIADDRKRSIFCSIAKGHKLEKLAAFHNLSPQEVVQEFRATVREMRHRIKEGAFTAKESVNIRLLHERNELKHKVRNYEDMYEKLQLANNSLHEQITLLRNDKEKVWEDEVTARLEKELAIREEIRKKLLEEPEGQPEKQAEEQTTRPLSHASNIMRWIRWLKMVYLRL